MYSIYIKTLKIDSKNANNPVKIQARNLNRPLAKEDTDYIVDHLKIRVTPLAIRTIQNKRAVVVALE